MMTGSPATITGGGEDEEAQSQEQQASTNKGPVAKKSKLFYC